MVRFRSFPDGPRIAATHGDAVGAPRWHSAVSVGYFQCGRYAACMLTFGTARDRHPRTNRKTSQSFHEIRLGTPISSTMALWKARNEKTRHRLRNPHTCE